jgi:hypothetical protein
MNGALPLLQLATTGATRLAALEQLAESVIESEGAAPGHLPNDPTQQKETDMTNSPNREPDAKPAPLDPRLTTTGRDISKELPSLGTPATGALGGSNAPTLAHSK